MKKVYLAGGMSGLNYEQSGLWRDEIESILTQCRGAFEVFNPVTMDLTESYRAYERSKDDINREAMRMDLWHLKHSDLVIYNDNAVSIGSSIELGIAMMLDIPVVTLKEENIEDIHPWIKEISFDVFDDMQKLISFIINEFQ